MKRRILLRLRLGIESEAETNNGGKMKKSIITIACAMIAPIAFAQTSTTTETKTTNPLTGKTTTETSTTYSAGTVTTYEPGKTIVVKDADGNPISYVLGTAARIIDGAGKIVTAPLRAGQKVKVYYTGPTEKRVVERVVVDQD